MIRRGFEDPTIAFIPPEAESEEGFSISLKGVPLGAAVLAVKKGPDAGSTFIIDKDRTGCGRDPHSDLFLDDVTVSRKHAEFVRERDRFRILDLGSLNGTFVNGERVKNARLRSGDEVQIGKFKFVFLETPST